MNNITIAFMKYQWFKTRKNWPKTFGGVLALTMLATTIFKWRFSKTLFTLKTEVFIAGFYISRLNCSYHKRNKSDLFSTLTKQTRKYKTTHVPAIVKDFTSRQVSNVEDFIDENYKKLQNSKNCNKGLSINKFHKELIDHNL